MVNLPNALPEVKVRKEVKLEDLEAAKGLFDPPQIMSPQLSPSMQEIREESHAWEIFLGILIVLAIFMLGFGAGVMYAQNQYMRQIINSQLVRPQ